MKIVGRVTEVKATYIEKLVGSLEIVGKDLHVVFAQARGSGIFRVGKDFKVNVGDCFELELTKVQEEEQNGN